VHLAADEERRRAEHAALHRFFGRRDQARLHLGVGHQRAEGLGVEAVGGQHAGQHGAVAQVARRAPQGVEDDVVETPEVGRASVLIGKKGLKLNGTPNFAAQRCRSPIIHLPLAGTLTGLALPAALNTPPSSIGRQTTCAPRSAATAGSRLKAM
jgi:hypothetical protein